MQFARNESKGNVTHMLRLSMGESEVKEKTINNA